jgi:hypothetical protein
VGLTWGKEEQKEKGCGVSTYPVCGKQVRTEDCRDQKSTSCTHKSLTELTWKLSGAFQLPFSQISFCQCLCLPGLLTDCEHSP